SNCGSRGLPTNMDCSAREPPTPAFLSPSWRISRGFGTLVMPAETHCRRGAGTTCSDAPARSGRRAREDAADEDVDRPGEPLLAGAGHDLLAGGVDAGVLFRRGAVDRLGDGAVRCSRVRVLGVFRRD